MLLFILYIICFFVQLLFILVVFSRLAAFAPSPKDHHEHGVSVVIVVHNQLDLLKNNLLAFLHQDYPNFEVIVVNNTSVDNSEALLMVMENTYPHLKVIHLDEKTIRKSSHKLALTIGIKAAKNDIILSSEISCIPASKKWIRLMQRNFSREVDIVLGYAQLTQHPTKIDAILQYDNLIDAIQYLSWALLAKAYKGIPQNIGYRKSVFLANNGFATHLHLPTGETDVFIKEISKPKNTRIEIHKEAQMITNIENSLTEWVNIKKYRLVSLFYYSFFHKFVLFMYWFSWYVFNSIFALAFFVEIAAIPTLFAFFMLRLIIHLIIVGTCADRLNVRSFIWKIPALEYTLMAINLLFLFYKKEKTPPF